MGETFFFREDIDDVETEISKEEAPGRNPISKLGKSKSEELDTHTDRSSSGPTGKNYLNIPMMSPLRAKGNFTVVWLVSD